MCILCVLYGEQLAAHSHPSTDTTFTYPPGIGGIGPAAVSTDVDEEAAAYLSGNFPPGSIPYSIAPLKTTGDGNCLLHAVSRALWGVELFHALLREDMRTEMTSHADWYRERIGDQSAEWDSLVAAAGTNGSHLGFVHAFALCNVLRRPLAVFASASDIERFGSGEDGAAALFLPLRHDAASCPTKLPVVIGWANAFRAHFVPIIRLDDGRPVRFPALRVAFAAGALSGSGNGGRGEAAAEAAALAEYVDFSENPKHPTAHKFISERGAEALRAPPTPQSASSAAADVLRMAQIIQTLGDIARERTMSARAMRTARVIAAARGGMSMYRRTNPSDGRTYDLVLPVHTGHSVEFVGCNAGDDKAAVARAFVSSRGLSARYAPVIAKYLEDALDATLEGSPLPSIVGLRPSSRHTSEAAMAVAMSIFPVGNAPVPQLFPVPFNAVPSVAVVADFGSQWAKGELDGDVSSVSALLESTRRTTSGTADLASESEEVCVAGVKQLLLALSWRPLPYCVIEIARFVALHPVGNDVFGSYEALRVACESLTPVSSAPYASHVAFVRWFANVLCFARINDFRGGVHKSLRVYIREVSRTRSLDLAKAIAVLLLNAAVVCNRADDCIFVAEVIAAMLRGHRACAPAERTLVAALGTLVHNSEEARAASVGLGVIPELTRIAEDKSRGDDSQLASLVLSMCSP